MISIHVMRDGHTLARLRIEGQHLDVWAKGEAPFTVLLEPPDPRAGPLDLVRAALDAINERQEA